MSPIMSWPIPSSHFLRRTESSTEDTEQVSSTGVNHKRFISIKLSPDRHLDLYPLKGAQRRSRLWIRPEPPG
jgi:hypothetical protein